MRAECAVVVKKEFKCASQESHGMSGNIAKSTDMPSDVVAAEFRIVVFSVPDDLESLQQALTALPDMDTATARLQSHLLPGIVPHSYSQDLAVAVAAEIERCGATATPVPACDVPDLMHAHPIHHLRIKEDVLESLDTSDKMQSCPWSAVSVISVGVLPSTAPSRFRSPSALASGSSHRTWNEGVRLAAKRRPEAFVVLSDGQAALNIASDELNYEYLGDRLSTSSSANFRLLIQDLVGRASGAWVTPSTVAFLEHTTVPRSEFRSHDEFRRYTEFQTLLSHRQMKPAQSTRGG
jgi:hypothetical protein